MFDGLADCGSRVTGANCGKFDGGSAVTGEERVSKECWDSPRWSLPSFGPVGLTHQHQVGLLWSVGGVRWRGRNS